jgi:hypothetical protein
MPKSCLFPYRYILQSMGRVSVFPAAEVSFRTTAGEWAPTFLLIDSGATLSTLPKCDAALLGVELKAGEPATVRGFSGKLVRGWRHRIRIRFQESELVIPLVFVNSDTTPRVLGREGVFEHFTIVLDESRHRSGFLGIDTPEADTLRSVLDQLQQR